MGINEIFVLLFSSLIIFKLYIRVTDKHKIKKYSISSNCSYSINNEKDENDLSYFHLIKFYIKQNTTLINNVVRNHDSIRDNGKKSAI
jgi:hypothetical protein